jgi:hypothetical protein
MLLHGTNKLNPSGLNIFGGQFLPHFYNYGSLQLVLINIAVSISSAYIHTTFIIATLRLDYLVGRLLTAVMGTATVWVVWALGRRLYGSLTGFFAALFLALMPLHVQHSHFMTVDVPAAFWVTLTLLWCAKSHTDNARLRALLVAGCFAGFAAATKYNCALVLLPLFLVALIKPENEAETSQKPSRPVGMIWAFAAALVAYLIACPGTVLENGIFARDFLFEARHVATQQELWFQDTGIGWFYIVERNLADGLGWPLLLTAIVGAVYCCRKRSFGDLLTLSFTLPYYLVVGAAVSRYARYEVPLLPFLALWAARLLAGQIDSAKSLAIKRSAIALTTAIIAFTALSAAFLVTPLLQTDPRDRAAEWLTRNVAPTAAIGMPVEPWFWTPPIDPYFCSPGVGEWRSDPGGQATADRLVVNPGKAFDTALLQASKPQYVVMNEYEYFDRLRIKNPDAVAYMAEIRRSYGPPTVFADVHWLGGRHSIDGLPCQDLPHDMLYPSPTVLVFKRI